MIHNIKFRAFVYENESVDEISQAILNILPEAEIKLEFEDEVSKGIIEESELFHDKKYFLNLLFQTYPFLCSFR